MNALIKNLFDDVFGKDIEKFHNEVDNFMSDVYKETQVPYFVLSRGGYPKVNIIENESQYVIMAAVPGMTKGDIDITYKDTMLSIVGKTRNDKNESNEKYIYRELKKSAFNRSFRIDPSQVEIGSIQSKLENGELIITIPKPNKEKTSEGIKINIE